MDPRRRNLLLECSSLEIGETSYEVACPSCGQKSFSVTRNSEGILYNCFRIKCQYRGFIPSVVTEVFTPTKHKVKKYEPIETENLSNDHLEFFSYEFSLSEQVLTNWGVKWAPRFNRVAFPIRDYLGREIGVTLRGYKQLANYGGNKTLHYKYSDSVPFAYYCFAADLAPILTIVEDPVSCIKINSAGFDCIALLGTNLSSDLIKFCKGKRIILWLDEDAIHKSVDYKHRYRMFVKDIIICTSIKDPKDLEQEEIIDRLSRWYGT